MAENDNKRRYYSQRTGKRSIEMDLDALKAIFSNLYTDFLNRQYFDEYFGKDCPDDQSLGIVGDPQAYVLRKLRKNNLWPIEKKYLEYTEEDLFDMIEFLFDHISHPILDSDAHYHDFCNCGYHYKNFDKKLAQIEYVENINEFLNDYGDGYELNHNGEIYSLLKEEFRPLLSASIPTNETDNVEKKVRKAVDKFRRYGSTLDERRESVRTLADCLEYVRSDLKKVLTNKDDGDLFNIANNFGIRHHNDKQKTNYDQNIWLSWMFYFYLSTIHASLRLIDKQKNVNK